MSTEIKQQPNTLALGTFVHTAKEMEVSVYTLRELAKDCRKRAAEAPVGPRNEIRRLEEVMHKTKNEIAYLSVQKSNREKKVPKEKNRTFNNFIGWSFLAGAFIFTGLALVSSFVNAIITGEFADGINGISGIIMMGVNLLITIPFALIIGNIIDKRMRKKEFEKELSAREGALNTFSREIGFRENNLCGYSSRLAHAREQLRRAEWKAVGLLEEAEELEARADQINSILQSCYVSTNVIGPDYRHIDCMVVFDHVFRNDLADNVRQAVAYYEEKKYRDMVLRGIDNVFQMLGKMAEVMLDVRQILVGISGDVERMSYDMNELLDNQSRMAQTQKAVLQESKASRYAAQQHYAAQQAHNDYVRNQIHWNS